jgi:quercetin dioxygenase-like cupin family protein
MTSIVWTTVLALWAATAQSYPPPFPRENAAKVLENDRMVVWDVTWPKGKATAMHQHTSDVAVVFIAPGATKTTTLDGASNQNAPVKVGDILFQNRGVIHREEGTTDSPRRGIVVELKDMKVAPLPLKPGVPPAFPRENVKKLMENERVTFWEYQWVPGGPVSTHHHIRQAVAVFLAPGQMKSVTPEGMVETNDVALGTVRAAAPGQIHTEEAVKGSPRAVIIELK